MRNEYDFSKGKQNPYINKLQKQISITLDIDTIVEDSEMDEILVFENDLKKGLSDINNGQYKIVE